MAANDKIILEGVVLYGYHGRNEEEKRLGQRFVVDVEAERDLSKAGQSDAIKDTVSYTDIYRVVKEVVEGPSHNLLESVAHEIAEKILSRLAIDAVRVRIKKPSPPIEGAHLTGAGVEIYRRKGK